MRCPYCGGLDSQVKDSRPTEDNSSIRRRRACPDCGGRFTTFERVQLRELVVVKKSGRRVPFDRDKLQRSVNVALRKRDVPPERIERMINGVVRQLELFEREADRLGRAPPVIESADVLRAPGPALRALCAAIDLPFRAEMLSWPAGRRRSDGVWAPAWYDQVERSTGFRARPEGAVPVLPPALARVAEAADPYYAALARWRLEVQPTSRT